MEISVKLTLYTVLLKFECALVCWLCIIHWGVLSAFGYQIITVVFMLCDTVDYIIGTVLVL